MYDDDFGSLDFEILECWTLEFWEFGLDFVNLDFLSFRIWILGDLDFGNLDLLRMLWIWDFDTSTGFFL